MVLDQTLQRRAVTGSVYFLLLISIGCSPQPSPLISNATQPEAKIPQELRIRIDAGMDPGTAKILKSDFSKLAQLRRKATEALSPLSPETPFSSVFGQGPLALSEGAISFLNSRVKFILGSQLPTGMTDSKDWDLVSAWNLGLWEFLHALQTQDPNPHWVHPSGEILSTGSPRSGLVQLGPAFSEDSSFVSRLAILIHEGRHSDCTVTPSDQGFRNTVFPEASTRATSKCGHLHSQCPENFPVATLRGLYACDSEPWGAYAIGGLWLKDLYFNCENCQDDVKEAARIAAIDRASRIDPATAYEGSPDLWSVTDLLGTRETSELEPSFFRDAVRDTQ